MKYKAFISYKHERSTAFARRLELSLKRYAKPFLARPMRLFRDENHLVPGADLPGMIREALEDSEFLILLASPEAARSPWVKDELETWCRDPSRVDRLIIILTAGTIEVLPTRDIDWAKTDALPEMLQWNLRSLPLWVDLRWAVAPELQDLAHPDFKRALNQISARLRGIDPNEMLGVEVREYRRRLAWISASVTAIVLLSVAVGIAGLMVRQRGILAENRLLSATRTANEVNVILNRKLSEIPGTASVRRELLDLSTDLLTRLQGDEHPEVFHTQAIAKVEAGDYAHERGKPAKAGQFYREARELFDRALSFDRTNGWILENLVLASLKEGRIAEERGHLIDAKRRFQEARRIAEALVESGDLDPRWNLRLASTLEALADVEAKTGILREQEALLNKAQEYRNLVADASRPTDRADRTVALLKLGDLYRATGRTNSAKKNYEAGLNELTILLEAYPARADFQYSWAVFAERLGERAHIRTAIERLTKMVAAEPDRTTWVRQLAILYTKLGEQAFAVGQLSAASEHFEKAESLLADLAQRPARAREDTRLLAELFDRVADAKKASGTEDPTPLYSKALALKTRLAETEPDDLEVRHGIAATHSKLADWSFRRRHLAEARRHVDAARKILEELVAWSPNRPDWLGDLAGVWELQARLDPEIDTLERAVSLRREVLKLYPYFNPEAETALSNALLRTTDAAYSADPEKAKASYQEAEKLLRQLTRADGPPDRTWEVLAVVLERQGSHSADRDIALRYFEEALNIARSRSKLRPEDAHWASLKAGFLERLASKVAATDSERARTLLDESLETRNRLANQLPFDLSAQRNLAVIHYKLGVADRGANNLGGAAQHFNESLDIAKRLSQRDPPVRQALFDTIEFAAVLANLAIKRQDWSSATTYVELITAARTRLLQDQHDGIPLSEKEKAAQRTSLVKNFENLAALRNILNDREGALAAQRQANTLAD